jgi:hypothetical protein
MIYPTKPYDIKKLNAVAPVSITAGFPLKTGSFGVAEMLIEGTVIDTAFQSELNHALAVQKSSVSAQIIRTQIQSPSKFPI